MSVQLVLGHGFLTSLADLTNNDKGRALEFVTKLRDDPSHPSLSLERVTRARSAGVWSGRVSRGLRAILYRDSEAWVVVHVGQHDPAYQWAERHDIGRNAQTGELQVIELPTVRAEDARGAKPVAAGDEAPRLFAGRSDAYLESLGTPTIWLPTLREVTSEDELLQVVAKLPQELAERLLRVGMGELVTPPAPLPSAEPVPVGAQPGLFVVTDQSSLEAVMRAPLERWIAFLHPTQTRLVTMSPNGPMKVVGGAGTGKTTVALHRARHLARQGMRVLITTFVSTLAHNLRRQLELLCAADELQRISVSTVHARALAVARAGDALVSAVDDQRRVRAALERARTAHAPGFDPGFVRAEYEAIVASQGCRNWAEYRAAKRVGRGRPLSVQERKTLWQVFDAAKDELRAQRQLDWSELCHYATELLGAGTVSSPFDAVLVDEVQDLRVPELRFLRALAGAHPERLALFGDTGQRLYHRGFTLSALGIDVRGRSHTLRINYRTTEQIRRAADRLQGEVGDDMDGGSEGRASKSLHAGPEPVFSGFDLAESEREAGVRIIREWLAAGLEGEAISVFARTNGRAAAMQRALVDAGVAAVALDNDVLGPGVRVGTMHRAKGLEFKAVLLHDVSAGSLPSQPALDACEDPQDREDVEARERNLLYVAMTRARDRLAVTWTGVPSPYLAALTVTAMR